MTSADYDVRKTFLILLNVELNEKNLRDWQYYVNDCFEDLINFAIETKLPLASYDDSENVIFVQFYEDHPPMQVSLNEPFERYPFHSIVEEDLDEDDAKSITVDQHATTIEWNGSPQLDGEESENIENSLEESSTKDTTAMENLAEHHHDEDSFKFKVRLGSIVNCVMYFFLLWFLTSKLITRSVSDTFLPKRRKSKINRRAYSSLKTRKK